MSAREIITTAMCDAGLDNVQDDDADYLLNALEAAGYRILPPGQLDRKTIEKCADRLEQIDEGLANTYSSAGSDDRRNDLACERLGIQRAIKAIRALGEEK